MRDSKYEKGSRYFFYLKGNNPNVIRITLILNNNKCVEVLKCFNVSSDKDPSYQLYKLESREELSKTE
jgi:hypothetical protein